MALPLFRSYVLLIVSCIFTVLIDVSQSVKIPSGCKIFLAKNNKISLPKGFEVHKPIGFTGVFPVNWLVHTDDGVILELPEAWSVTLPDGFQVIIPSEVKMPPKGWFDESGGKCKMTLYPGWTVTPTETWKEIVITEGHGKAEGLIDITIGEGSEHSFDLAVEILIPKCKIVLPKNNKIVFPKGFEIHKPIGFTGVFPVNWLVHTDDGIIVNLPESFSVSLPDGFKIAPPNGWIGGGAFPKWFEEKGDGSIVVHVPPSWIVVPTDEFKKNNHGGSIDIIHE